MDLLRSGYRILFLYPPVLLVTPIYFPSHTATVLQKTVEDMKNKQAIEPADPRSLDFYGRLFVVPEWNGKWRSVIDQ